MSIELTEVSDSRLPTLTKCMGAVAHPSLASVNAKAIMGTAIHAHLELRAKVGLTEAIDCIPQTISEYPLTDVEHAIACARCRNFRYEPPSGAIPELALAWKIEDEEAEVVTVEGGQGKYALPEGVYAPGTIDLIYATPTPLDLSGPVPVCPPDSTLWVVDYKTGSDVWVDSIETNAQLASGAAKAAYWTGANRVMPAILYVEKGEGTWDVFDEPWGIDEIDEAMWRTFDLHGRIAEARRNRPAANEYLEGYHCQFCPSLAYCPMKAKRLRTLLEYETNRREGPITEKELSRMTAMLPIVRKLAEWIEEVAKAAVLERGPIDVGSGRYYGPQWKKRERLDPAAMLPIVEEVLGDHASAMQAMRLSKSGIGEAIKARHEVLGIKRQASQAMRTILAKGHKQNAIYEEDYTSWGIYVPEEFDNKDTEGKDQ